MNREKWVWFDMDGTIADLYNVDNWLEDILSHSTEPFKKAKDLYQLGDLLGLMVELKLKGYKIGIVSWSTKERNASFDVEVTIAKREWLERRLLDIFLDEIIIAPYGTCKADLCRKFGEGILVDDEEQNRKAWDLGLTVDANEDIISLLKTITK